MKSIKLLHIGDVHYPEEANKLPQIDQKDDGFDQNFINKLAPNPFVEVGNTLASCLETEDIDGVLFSGDLTSAGKIQEYNKCVRYFDRLITSAEEVTEKKISVHVVPGNHDLKRYGLESNDIEERFHDFKAAWDKTGRDIFPVNSIKSAQLNKDNMSLNVISLNTCLGCGEEYKRLPEEVASTIKEIIDSAENITDKEQFNDFCDRIDTPAIYQQHLTEIEQEVNGGADNSLSLILGHHALLPQPTVRVALYTELLNGGNARMSLTTLRNPIIYCHGHIHDDPIEIVSSPNNDNSSLVLMSAPEYSSGFNIIEVAYTDSGYPVGLTVHPYRAESWGRVRREDCIEIPIRQPEEMLNFCDENTEKVYRSLDGEPIRFDKILDNLSSDGLNVSADDLENILSELEWLRVISISNKKKASRGWVVGRIGL